MKAKKIVKAKPILSLLEVLKRVPDHRVAEGKRHPLFAILTLITVATICGCQGQRGIAMWGRIQPQKVRRALGFTRRRTPAHSTLHVVLKLLDVAAFEQALRDWAATLGPSDMKSLRAIALDGKTVRGSIGKDTPGVHVMTAFDVGRGIVLASMAVKTKSSEARVAEELLPALPLRGAVLTGDAAQTQRRLCRAVVEGGGDYMFTVKDNQPNLRQAIETAFDPPSSPL